MAKKEAQKPMTRRKARLVSGLLLAAAFIASAASVMAALRPVSYDLAIGDAPDTAIYAPRDALDRNATQALTDRARENAQKFYAIDTETVDELIGGAELFFARLNEVRDMAAAMLDPEQTPPASPADWSAALDAQDKGTLYAITAPVLDEGTLTGVLCATTQELTTLKDVVLSKLRTSLEAGLSQEGVAGVRSSCTREINAMTGVSAALKQAATLVFDSFMQPTLVLDEAATLASQDEAAAAVEPVTVKKGELVAERGVPLTAVQYALLSEYGLVKTEETGAAPDVGVLLMVLVAFAVFAGYAVLLRRELIHDVKSIIILTVLISLTMGIALLSGKVDTRLSPALIAIMLAALLTDERTALALTALMSVLMGLMGAAGDAALGAGSFALCAATAASGAAAVLSLRHTQSRGAIIAAGAIGGAAAAIVETAACLYAQCSFGETLIAIAWTFGSAAVSALLVTGSLTLWENIFDVATSARLNELTNANHPLLRQLMSEAPGTYQHSVMTAALAEAAAERIGAQALLARVASYYHDVGKLRRPLYFKENQKNGENIHDTLPPAESAQTIIAHQKDGITLLTKFKLPSAVIRICGEHHGNSLMTYFYFKAKQADPNVKEKGFRYTGNRPSSKESAIVMMADSCEAAVRSLGETSSEAVGQMVHKIIWGKLNPEDNMMSNAPLTMAEFSEIEKSFLKTFSGIMHDRIEYPDMDEAKNDRV